MLTGILKGDELAATGFIPKVGIRLERSAVFDGEKGTWNSRGRFFNVKKEIKEGFIEKQTEFCACNH